MSTNELPPPRNELIGIVRTAKAQALRLIEGAESHADARRTKADLRLTLDVLESALASAQPSAGGGQPFYPAGGWPPIPCVPHKPTQVLAYAMECVAQERAAHRAATPSEPTPAAATVKESLIVGTPAAAGSAEAVAPERILQLLPKPNMPAGYPYLSRVIGTDLWDADQIVGAVAALLATPPAQTPAPTEEPVGTVQHMGSYKGVPVLGCLLSIEAEKRLKVGDKLYAAPIPALNEAGAQAHDEVLAEVVEALKASLKKGAKWHPCDQVVVQARAALARAAGLQGGEGGRG